ncbi:MAG: glycosyltransferase family 4 protein [Gemmatimonadetes bacterium]|nr:glycosyltransferase family 4 protein [Gemmatimonadota bacterium]
MKVLYVVTAYPRWPGDVITPWLVETIRRLRERGVQVEVLAPSYRGSSDQVVDGVRVHRFRYAPARLETLTHDQTAPDRVREKPWYLGLVPAYVMAGRRATRALARTGDFDVVHVFWPVPHGLFGMAAKRSGGPPLVSTFFGVELSWLKGQLRMLRPVVRAIIRASDVVTVISSHTAAAVRQVVPGATVRTIPFGAALDGDDSAAAPRVRQPGEPFQLLFVGRLVERKGVHILLEAVAALKDTRDLCLVVVGEGPERAALTVLAEGLGIADRVEFTGPITPDELRIRYSRCDAFVLPAVRDSKGDVEGLGVVLIEALLQGKPVIASASGGIVDIVRHGETGLLAPAGDSTALAEAITAYMDDPELALRLAYEGRAHVLREFSWSTITDRLVEVYEELAGLRKEIR